MSLSFTGFLWGAAALTAAACGALVACGFARSLRARGGWFLAGLLLLFPAVVTVVGLGPWALVDPRFLSFWRFHDDLRPGMTRSEVLAALEHRYPAGGARGRPRLMRDTAEALGFLMDPEHLAEPNGELILVRLDEGRVVAVEYSAD